MTDFLQLATERYSVRKFTGEPVAQAALNQILQAGHLAPTAHNFQPQRILVLTDPQLLSKLPKCTPCHFNAPTAMIICADKTRSWKRKYDGKDSGDIDAAIVTTHMMLAAHALGVGTTWVMHFDPAALRAEFAIPTDLEPVAILPMGYPAADAAPFPGHSEFRDPADIVAYNQF